jgi:adenylate cyclase class 2
MADEVEAKFKITDNEADAILAKLGRPQTRCETNIFYDTDSRKLEGRGESLRIRSESYSDGHTHFVMTFKGKKKKSRFKIRPEYETKVSSLEEASNIVTALGYKEFFRFEKRRSSYHFDECVIEVDQLPLIGHFCEIEAPSINKIEQMLKQLGFENRTLIVKGYGQLVAAAAKARKIISKDITFASCKS